MKKAMGFGLLALLSGALVACMDIRAVDKNDKEDPAPVQGLPGWPAAVRTSGWNGYHVSLPADVTWGAVRKSRWQPASKTFAAPAFLPVVPGSAFVDADVIPGEVYSYEWGSMRNGEFKAAGRRRVAVPLDLEIKAGETLDAEKRAKLFETERFGTLIIGEATILTEGRDLNWIADEIRFDHATVRSFEPGARARIGEHGRSGGRVIVRAARASGVVRFELRGEDGGPGLAGKEPGEELRGPPGTGGSLPTRISGRNPFEGSCVGGTAGTNGGQGKRGHSGGKGGDGGDSGEIVIQVGDRRDLEVDAVLDVGHGGPGGPGGEGGLGGEGAPLNPPPGTLIFSKCGPSAKGAPGDRGPTGESGAPGARGQYRRVCYVDADKAPECR